MIGVNGNLQHKACTNEYSSHQRLQVGCHPQGMRTTGYPALLGMCPIAQEGDKWLQRGVLPELQLIVIVTVIAWDSDEWLLHRGV